MNLTDYDEVIMNLIMFRFFLYYYSGCGTDCQLRILEVLFDKLSKKLQKTQVYNVILHCFTLYEGVQNDSSSFLYN